MGEPLFDHLFNKWSNNLTKGRIATAHGRFNRIRQVASMSTSNTCFTGHTTHSIPNNISIGSDRVRDHYRRTDRPRCSVCYNRPHLRI